MRNYAQKAMWCILSYFTSILRKHWNGQTCVFFSKDYKTVASFKKQDPIVLSFKDHNYILIVKHTLYNGHFKLGFSNNKLSLWRGKIQVKANHDLNQWQVLLSQNKGRLGKISILCTYAIIEMMNRHKAIIKYYNLPCQ